MSGYKLNMRKCGVVLQGIEWDNTEATIPGFHIQRKPKYLAPSWVMQRPWSSSKDRWPNCRQRHNFWPPYLYKSVKRCKHYIYGRTRCYGTWRYRVFQPRR